MKIFNNLIEDRSALTFFFPKKTFVLRLSLEEKIESWNQDLEELFGYSSKEVIGKNISVLFSIKEENNIFENLKIPSGNDDILIHNIEKILVSKAKKSIPSFIESFGVRNESGSLISIHLVIHDCSVYSLLNSNVTDLNNLLKNLSNNIHESIILIDPKDDKIIDLNKISEKMFGFPPEELIGIPIQEIFSDNADFNDFWIRNKNVDAKCSFWGEYVMKRKNGDTFLAEHQLDYIYEQDKSIKWIVDIISDISGRRYSENIERKHEKRLLNVLETSPDSILISRMSDGKIILLNESFEKFLGHSKIEVIGKSINDLKIWKNPGDGKKFIEFISKDGKVANFESQFKCKDSNIKIGLVSASIIEIDNEKFVFSVTHDISERKKNEEELNVYRKNLERLVQERTRKLIETTRNLEEEIREQKKLEISLSKSQVILNSIGDGIITLDENDTITSFNKAAQRILGYQSEEVMGKKYNDYFNIVKSISNPEISISKGRELSIQKSYIRNKKGNIIPITINMTILEGSGGAASEFAIAFQDISQIENLRIEIAKDYIFQGMISKNQKMLEIFSILPDIARSNSAVLIEGPTGTGKELLAKAVYSLSNRSEKPFIVVNCGAMPPSLMESELFGFVKGSFTDAKSNKQGKIIAADGGTIFFDEIGELPMDLQVKLLRLLDNYEVDQIGMTKPIKVDVRVIAATNRNLKSMVQANQFREDLFYRLNTVRIYLPGLFERKEDIPILIDHFIQKFNAKSEKNIIEVDPDVLKILMEYSYPGNVRELEKIIEYCFILCKNQTISIKDLPHALTKQPDVPIVKVSDRIVLNTEQWEKDKKASEIEEREKIINTLNKYNGNKSKACKELNIHYTTLFKKIKKYNLDTEFKNNHS